MEMGTKHHKDIEVTIINTENHNLLLETNWLKAHNPSINWTRNKLLLNQCFTLCFSTPPQKPEDPILGYLLPTLEWEEQYDDFIETRYQGIDVLQCIMAHLQMYLHPVVARTTISTAITKEATKSMVEVIPLAFHKYKKVFSDEEAQQLPKHQPWDHKIDLILGQQIGRTSVYRLTPPEKIMLKDYIKDGLKRGTLCCSEAPNTCSFFFIDKKDSKL
jgi:hypothetical protein